jgi:putative membrane protein
MKYVTCVGTVVLAMSLTPAFAQSQPPTQPQTPPTARPQTQPRNPTADMQKSAKADSSQQFVKEAAIGGMAEVELGRLAADKASSDQVKKFGQRMVDDHGRANDELKTLAQNKNIDLPSSLDAKHQATMDRLSKLSGDAFDRAYMSEMVKDHRMDVNEFRNEAKSG